MTKDDFIREFVLRWARTMNNEGESVDHVIRIAKQYANELYPVDPLARHKDICKILRYMDFNKLASQPVEEKYSLISECLSKELSIPELNLYSHLK